MKNSSSAVRKTAEQHISSDPFCAAHPDLAGQPNRRVLRDDDDAGIPVTRRDTHGARHHSKTDTVISSRKT